MEIPSWFAIVTVILSTSSISATHETNSTDTLSIAIDNGSDTRILSRKKRFLIFPDGSSVQLVFCTQNHGYMQVGDIVWFAETASLAWELPKDPNIFHFFKSQKREPEETAQRRGDSVRHIYYLDEKGKLIDKVPYTRKFITPVLAKRSVDNLKSEGNVDKIDVKQMHELQKRRDFLKSDSLSDSSVEYHRNGRKGLYEKVETYLESLGWKGRGCVLKMLCESGKERGFQGTFVEEILRAIFTLPRGQRFDKQQHQEYDRAHYSQGDCNELYPDCEESDSGTPQQFL